MYISQGQTYYFKGSLISSIALRVLSKLKQEYTEKKSVAQERHN